MKTVLGGTVVYVQRVSALDHMGEATDTITDTSKAVGSPLQGDIAATCRNTTGPQAAGPPAASRLQAFLYIYVYVYLCIYLCSYVSMYLCIYVSIYIGMYIGTHTHTHENLLVRNGETFSPFCILFHHFAPEGFC
jgi:hypothetical protein